MKKIGWSLILILWMLVLEGPGAALSATERRLRALEEKILALENQDKKADYCSNMLERVAFASYLLPMRGKKIFKTFAKLILSYF